MKNCVALALVLSLTATAWGIKTKGEENNGAMQNQEIHKTDYTDGKPGTESGRGVENGGKLEETAVQMNQIYIKVGENVLMAVLEDNQSAKALKALLAEGPLTLPASNYGGFEKVCSLGEELPRNDSHITTHAGDICLYNGSQIVMFYGSNSWAYTRLGKISDGQGTEPENALSGEETEITISLDLLH